MSLSIHVRYPPVTVDEFGEYEAAIDAECVPLGEEEPSSPRADLLSRMARIADQLGLRPELDAFLQDSDAPPKA